MTVKNCKIEYSTFYSNIETFGGAISENSNLFLQNTEIFNNSAYAGGGVYFLGTIYLGYAGFVCISLLFLSLSIC